MSTYPRDLVGYGARPPHPRWPGDARIAVQFVINYEEGGENCILHGDEASEAFLSEIVGAAPWAGQRHMNMESIYEYGSRAGFWRLHRMFTERKLPVTVFGITSAMARHPEIVRAMLDSGWDIASHGLKWIDYRNLPAETEAAHIAEAVRIQTELTGARPTGLYQGRTSENTLRLTQEEGGFLYSADTYADELPYWVEGPNGRGGQGPFLMVPYTLDANDMRFATPQGFNAGDQFFSYLKDSFDTLYAEGETAPKMMSVGLHCRLVGRPGRAASLAKFLNYVQSYADVWITTRQAIAEHWVMNHPPATGWQPSKLSRALFVARFGGIFEHSPWVAENTFAAGLGAETDTAAGLHLDMVKAMRRGTAGQQRDLILKHPDLAGKLAMANKLTADSTSEQASAGLDHLSDAEKAQFSGMNDAYKARFGIPYILAVKGKTKADIMANFKERLANTADQEFATALVQIERIALLRLSSLPGLAGGAA